MPQPKKITENVTGPENTRPTEHHIHHHTILSAVIGVCVLILVTGVTYYSLNRVGVLGGTKLPIIQNNSGAQNAPNTQNTDAQSQEDAAAPAEQELRGTVTQQSEGSFTVEAPAETGNAPRTYTILYTESTEFASVDTTRPPLPGTAQTLQKENITADSIQPGDVIAATVPSDTTGDTEDTSDMRTATSITKLE